MLETTSCNHQLKSPHGTEIYRNRTPTLANMHHKICVIFTFVGQRYILQVNMCMIKPSTDEV